MKDYHFDENATHRTVLNNNEQKKNKKTESKWHNDKLMEKENERNKKEKRM